MGIRKELKNKKGMVRKGIVRLCDPRDDRVGGLEENDEDDFEKPSPQKIGTTTEENQGEKNQHNSK
ncbi:MAG: hypothetical protein PHY88_00445 [Candidatus Omnitrophica bacterium]|nr:hypothetical protein [Candidatus Omnitrophota bacterium]